MNSKGRGSGLLLICLLIVALVVAWLVVTQRGSLEFGKTEMQQGQAEQMDPVQQAQDVVDAVNEAMGRNSVQEEEERCHFLRE